MEQKKPRWEKKYEDYKEHGSKYQNMKRKLTELKKGKVTGDFKTKEEYQNAVDARERQIAEYEKEVKGYENFKKNGQKVQNILDYRNGLIEKLDKLPKVRNEEETKKLNDKKEEQAAKAQRIGQYQVEIDDLKLQLKNKDLSDNDKQILLLTLKARMEAMGILQEEQSKLDREITSLEEIGKDVNEEVQRKTATYERKIAKCNIIAANLLKGKELGEFEIKVIPEYKRFTSNDGQLPKQVEQARLEHQNDRAGLDEPTVGEEEAGDNTHNDAEIVEDEPEITEEDREIAEVNDFATKHPILARIGNFFTNMGSRISNLFKRKDTDGNVEINHDESESTDELFEEIEAEGDGGNGYTDATVEELEDEIDDNEFATMLWNNMRNRRGNSTTSEQGVVNEEEPKISLDEDEFLKAVAEKGEEEALKDRRKAFREKISKEAANRYAEKYGGIYERQDGATAKKVETPKKEEEGR